MNLRPLLSLFALLAVGCGGARPRDEHASDTTSSSGTEVTTEDADREVGPTIEELARDPAWSDVPPADGARVDTTTTLRDTQTTAPRPCTGSCRAGEACIDPRAGWRCECTLHADLVCGGAYREPAPPQLLWSCAPTDPGTDRGDGCPFGEPTHGARCTTARAGCSYSSGCGYSGTTASCVGGHWQLESWAVPPPP